MRGKIRVFTPRADEVCADEGSYRPGPVAYLRRPQGFDRGHGARPIFRRTAIAHLKVNGI